MGLSEHRTMRLVAEWREARAEVVKLSIYPIGNEAFKAALNRLAEAEDKLAKG